MTMEKAIQALLKARANPSVRDNGEGPAHSEVAMNIVDGLSHLATCSCLFPQWHCDGPKEWNLLQDAEKICLRRNQVLPCDAINLN